VVLERRRNWAIMPSVPIFMSILFDVSKVLENVLAVYFDIFESF
jgi:hypothetical protein